MINVMQTFGQVFTTLFNLDLGPVKMGYVIGIFIAVPILALFLKR